MAQHPLSARYIYIPIPIEINDEWKGIQLNNGDECFDVHFAWRRQETDPAPSSPYQTQIEKKNWMKWKESLFVSNKQQTTVRHVVLHAVCTASGGTEKMLRDVESWYISINCDYGIDNDNTYLAETRRACCQCRYYYVSDTDCDCDPDSVKNENATEDTSRSISHTHERTMERAKIGNALSIRLYRLPKKRFSIFIFIFMGFRLSAFFDILFSISILLLFSLVCLTLAFVWFDIWRLHSMDRVSVPWHSADDSGYTWST